MHFDNMTGPDGGELKAAVAVAVAYLCLTLAFLIQLS